jgi:hypothetical protein
MLVTRRVAPTACGRSEHPACSITSVEKESDSVSTAAEKPRSNEELAARDALMHDEMSRHKEAWTRQHRSM